MKKIGVSFCVFFFVLLMGTSVHAATKGKIVKIDNAGYVHISLGENDGLSIGDIIEIRDESDTPIVRLAVQEVYMAEARLEIMRRKYLSKIEEGFPIYRLLRPDEKKPVVSETSETGRNVTIVAFDKTKQEGFVNLGYGDGIKDGMVFMVEKDNVLIGEIVIERTFESVSKFTGIAQMLMSSNVQACVLRQKKEKPKVLPAQWLSDLCDDFSGELRSIYTHYNVDRNKSQSFYKTGSNFREEIDLKYYKVTEGGITIDGFTSARWTDDSYVDPERYSIEDFYFQAKNESFMLRIGDFLGDFSDYTLLSSLKGATAELQGANVVGKWRVVSVFGLTKNLWEDMWKSVEGEDYTQYVYGMRLEHAIAERIMLGINAVRSDDDESGNGIGNPQDNFVTSFDFKGRLHDYFKIDGEFAKSWTQLDESGSSLKRSGDIAIDINTDIDIGKFKIENDYERVGAYFRTLNGIASTDREEFKHAVRFDYEDKFGTSLDLRRYRNNLKDTGNYTLFNTIYGFDSYVKPLYGILPDLQCAIDIEKHKKHSGDAATSVEEDRTTYDFTVENRSGSYYYGGGITIVRDIDTHSTRDTHRKAIYDVFLRSNYKWGEIRFLPYVMYEYERDKIRHEKQTDDFSTLRVGGAFYYGQHFSLSGSWVHTDLDYDFNDNDQTREYCDISLRMNLFNDINKVVRVSYKRNNYKKFTSANEFIENIFSCSYTQRF